MFRILFLIGLLLMLFSTCKTKDKDPINSATKAASNAENFSKYRVDFDYKGISDDSFLLNFGRIIHLPSMLQMRDSINIRIWIWGDTADVINISMNNSKDSCSVMQVTEQRIANKEYIVILSDLRNLYPQSGWANFADSINRYKKYFLNNKSRNLEEIDVLDKMAYIQFEINHRGKYRYNKYLEPSFYRYADTSSMKIFNFLKYFDYEFRVLAYNPTEKLFAYPKNKK